MKKVFLMTMLMLLITTAAKAQKYAMVDMESILKNIPAYQQATNQLEGLSKKWQSEIDNVRNDAKKMYETYQNQSTTMSASLRKNREDQIIAKEKQANDLKMKYFGSDGELYKQREILLKPIHDQIYSAIKEISQERGYGMVIDKASAQSIIYASSQIDISREVLARLGYLK